MGRIILMMPGNTLHSNVFPEAWERIDAAHAGIPVIGMSGVPVSISYQTMDYHLLPWLRDELANHPSIEVINAPFSHALIPLLQPRHQQWQMANGAHQLHPVSFFTEFYSPEEQFIPDAFLVLASQTVAYSVTSDATVPQVYVDPDIARHDAILYGGKLGLVMKGFEPILAAFFTWQRDPGNRIKLDALFTAIVETAEKTDGIIMWPIDIEAPWVGSLVGERIWETFFSEIVSRGLTGLFTTLNQALEELRPLAHESRRPHRALGAKWLKWELQFLEMARLSQIKPRSDREHMILSLAAASDLLSGLCSKIDESQRRIVLNATDMDGHPGTVQIGWSQPVVEACFAARHALDDGVTLQETLAELPDDYDCLLVRRLCDWAKANDL